jgi:prophage regulatory protein
MTSSTPKLLRLPVVLDRTGLSKPSIYRLMKLGQFPQAKKISSHATARAVCWLESDINSFIASR